MGEYDDFGAMLERAKSLDTSVKELEMLTQVGDRFISVFVAKNPNTPEELRVALTSDIHHWSVRYVAVALLETRKDVIKHVAIFDQDKSVREVAEWNDALTEEDRRDIRFLRKQYGIEQ